MIDYGLIFQSDYFKKYYDELKLILSIQSNLDFIQCVLLDGPEGSGKKLLIDQVADDQGYQTIVIELSNVFDDTIAASEKKLNKIIMDISANKPCLIYLANVEFLSQLEQSEQTRMLEAIKECLSLKNPKYFLVVASTNSFQAIFSSPVSSIFQHYIQLKQPTKIEAVQILEILQKQINHEVIKPSDLPNEGLYLGNLFDLLAHVELIICDDDKTETTVTMARLAEDVYSMFGRKLNSKADDTSWEDVGGLSKVKQEIIDTIQLSLDYPQLSESGLRRTGILLHGPPGTGKTLLARAVANECNLNFINVKGPELINMYVGQSEENIRNLFSSARENSPSVIFFDELDSLAPNRGIAGDSGGVMDRIVSQILAELDRLGSSDGVSVIGATNRVDLVDPSLLRPGRFDKVLEVSLPNDKESRIKILESLTRKMYLDEDVRIDWIESQVSGIQLSGADFQGLCSSALQNSIERNVKKIESELIEEENVILKTSREDFLLAIKDTIAN